jgi:hypothetical protein
MHKISSTYRLHKERLSCNSKCSENGHPAWVNSQNVDDFRDLPTGPDIALVSGQALPGVFA